MLLWGGRSHQVLLCCWRRLASQTRLCRSWSSLSLTNLVGVTPSHVSTTDQKTCSTNRRFWTCWRVVGPRFGARSSTGGAARSVSGASRLFRPPERSLESGGATRSELRYHAKTEVRRQLAYWALLFPPFRAILKRGYGNTSKSQVNSSSSGSSWLKPLGLKQVLYKN